MRPFGDGERRTVDRPHGAGPGAVVDLQAVDLEDHRAAQPRHEDLFVAAADEEARHHDQDDADAGRHEPGVLAARQRLRGEGVLQHVAPRHAVRIAEAQEADARLGDDRPADGDGGIDEAERQDVGRDVHEQDAPGAGAGDARRLDIGALPQRQHLAPDHARRVGPQQQGDGEHDVRRAGAQKARQHDDEGQEGQAERHVGDAHQHRVGRAAEIARHQADDGADGGDDDRGRQADRERAARAVHELGIDVAAEIGRAERELGAGRHVGRELAGLGEQDLQRIERRQLVGEQRHQREQHVDEQAGEGERIPERHRRHAPQHGQQRPARSRGKDGFSPFGHGSPAGRGPCREGRRRSSSAPAPARSSGRRPAPADSRGPRPPAPAGGRCRAS